MEEEEESDSEILAPPTRFAAPKTAEDVQKAKDDAVPKGTNKDTEWCVNLWKTWATERNTRTTQSNIPTDIADLSNADEELQSCLSLFVLKARKKGGSEYPPQTLHHIVCGLVRFLRRTKPGLDVFQDANFAQFRATLDAEMKRLKQAGVGSRARQAEALSDADEDLLWQTKYLVTTLPRRSSTRFFSQWSLLCSKKWRRAPSTQAQLRQPNKTSRTRWRKSLPGIC